MIEIAFYEHLKRQGELIDLLTKYGDKEDLEPAIFNQEFPADTDPLWFDNTQYPRVVFAEDLQGDPERIAGGTMVVDIMCRKDCQFPEDFEPILRRLIDGYFFSNGTFVVAAQWKASNYFTEPSNMVTGCTLSFDLLGFPMITTNRPDVIRRLNAWTCENFENLYVINHTCLPSTAWKPRRGEAAIYWRVAQDRPAGWIPDTFQTIWRTAIVRGHIFTGDMLKSSEVASDVITRLYARKRLLCPREAPIMVNQSNSIDNGADPLKTGQITVEATYGVIVHIEPDKTIENITHERKENL